MAKYITTSIPYVNAKPHAGHALEFVQTDVYARTLRLKGEDVRFLTGTDDNALKNVQAAEAAEQPIAEYVAENAAHFSALAERLAISNDDFIRTSVDERHRLGAEKLWSSTKPEDIYKKSYRGYYCVGCEEFKTEKDLVNGECHEHPGKMLEEIEEENYFFRLSAYQDILRDLIASDKLQVVPTGRKNEALAFIDGGLEDFSISRSAARAKGWGIQVPNDPDQYMYVWYDALANYITALDYADESELYRKYWVDAESKTHVIGKGINRFHTLYWPAMLLSAGVPLPTTVFIHGYINSGGQKMSKSLGNVIDPNDLVDRYGTDAVRYFLLRHIHPTEDSDLTLERCDEWYTANLVNGLGNLVARVMKLAETHLSEPIARPEESPFTDEYWQLVESFEFNKVMDLVWSRIQAADERITREEPFKVVKEDPEKGRKIIAELATELYQIGRLLNPFMPATNELIKKAVLENKKPENLFPRVD